MTNLYRLTPIEGKGFGIVASTFIKKGTLVLEEEAQMPYLDDEPDLQAIRAETWMNWIKNIMALYNKMTKSDQKEYLELYNQFESVPLKVELVSMELNHLAAILQVWRGFDFYEVKKIFLFKKKGEILLHS